MTFQFRPFDARSMLFVPGDRPERFDKAAASGADAICIDLEDAVVAARKALARDALLAFLRRRQAQVFVCVRINSLRSAEGLRDLLALFDAPRADAVVLPKTQGADELRLASEVCGGAGRQQWIALIESPAGLLQAPAIAANAPDLAALMFGGADFSAEIGSSFEWEALALARQTLVHAAALSRLPVIDVPYLDIQDAHGLRTETRRVASLGFTCKAAIHPSQVPVIQESFTPTPAQLARAKRIVEASQSSGAGGVITVDGTMVDGPVLASARRTLGRAPSGGV
jgi:citrate lyase beta subunit